MAQNILDGLFGMSPYEAQMAGQREAEQSALQMAQMNPNTFGSYLATRAGQGLGGMFAESQGMVDPRVQQAQMRQHTLGQAKLDTPDEIRATAERFRQMGDFKTAFGLSQYAKQMENEQRKATAEQQRLSTETAFKTAQMTKDLALAEKALRENPNLAVTEVGVKGKPGYLQKVVYDKTKPDAPYQEIGEPYQTPQAMKISMGGGVPSESIQPIPYIDPATGKPTWGTIKEARGKTAAAYDPVTKQLMTQAAAVGKGKGEEIINLPNQESALDSVKEASKMIDAGIYTGTWGPAMKTAIAATPGTDKKKVENTDQFVAYIGETVVPRLKEFGGNDSNEELKYLQKISGGDLTMQEGALKAILKRAESKIERGVNRVKKGMTPDGIPAQEAAKPVIREVWTRNAQGKLVKQVQ